MSKKYVLVESTASFKMKYAIPVDDINSHTTSDEDLIAYGKTLVEKEMVIDMYQKYMGDAITDSKILTEDEILEVYDSQFELKSDRTKEDKLKIIDNWEVDTI